MAQMRIKDIAVEAGVSPATVSRYLNNRPGQMTEETRARIAAVIERTGYRPRAAARNLRSSRTNLIGVILAAPCSKDFPPVPPRAAARS